MSAILKFGLKNTFFRRKLSKLHKKRHNFACDNYIFPKTKGNKNKQWKSITLPLKYQSHEKYLQCNILSQIVKNDE